MIDGSQVVGRGVLLVLMFAFAVRAEEPAAEKKNAERESAWQPYFAVQALDYQIAPTADAERTFSVRKEPLLRWSQPVRGGDDGAVYLWLDRGRPAAVGTIFAWPHSSGNYVVQHEFHSLSLEPISAVWRERSVWQPDRAGVELKPVPDAPVPADSPAGRLRQMRALVREFTAGSTDHNGGKWELRALNQPLHRYEVEKRDDVLDGALFAFVQGTDPEIILLIEARKSDGKNATWQFACARFSDFALRVQHKGAGVWEVESGNPQRTSPHYYFAAEQRQPPTAEEISELKRGE